MFRLYELYALYSKKMSSTWCLCEKLPRSILHIAPAPELWCDVCGRRRRPRGCLSSSSSDGEERRQRMPQSSVRVKVALSAKKPKSVRRTNCVNEGKPQPVKLNNKLNIGRFGHYRKPQRLPPKRKDEEPERQLAPPPSPPPAPPTSDSLWEQPSADMPRLVAFAHEVFNRPAQLRQRPPSFYDNLFVSDFIPLDKPITDAAGGAVSKQRKPFGRPLRTHCSRPLPPLSQVLSEMLAKPKMRAKGGGLATAKAEPAVEESNDTQFSPFDQYEGPSEDALVVDSARLMLRQTPALHIKQRPDLPSTRLASFESEPSSDCSSSSPVDVPTAPPAEREQLQRNYSAGAPLRLHEMMKAVAHSGLSGSSASSSSSSSSSSAGSTLPVRSRGGEEPPLAEAKLPISIIEKIVWLMEQKPPAEAGAANPQEEHSSLLEQPEEEARHTESVKGLLQFMESLHISEPGQRDDIPKNDAKMGDTDPVPESPHPNDMSTELPLNSTNKSAGDAKYANVLSSAKKCRGGKPNRSKSHSMWSLISGLFSGSGGAVAEEMKPLKSVKSLHYGSINSPKSLPGREIPQNCHKCGKKKSSKDITGTKNQVAPQYKEKKPKISSTKKQPIVNRASFKAHVNNEPAESSAPIQSATSSTRFESCFGVAMPSLEKVAESEPGHALRKKQLQELLHTIRANERRQRRFHHKAKIIGTVQYVSSEIIEPKMVAFARGAKKGQLQEKTVSSARSALDMFEFRTPDIQAVKLVANSDASSTPIAHSETGQQSEEFSANYKSVAESTNRALQKHNLPVWPAHPFRHRKRHIKYKLSYTVSNENICTENNHTSENVAKKLKNRISESSSEKWIVNESVQQKITEMMTKPIKLLTVNETN